jgi:hypothetical protein
MPFSDAAELLTAKNHAVLVVNIVLYSLQGSVFNLVANYDEPGWVAPVITVQRLVTVTGPSRAAHAGQQA